jgi:type II secretory pathway pseudopilin PulG
MRDIGRDSRGDTLVEVLFATAIFSLVAVGGLTIMNQGTATIQRGLEITQVRHEIDAQASALRFLNASYIASYIDSDAPLGAPVSEYTGPAKQWASMRSSIMAYGQNDFAPFGISATGTCPVPGPGRFIINARKGEFVAPANLIIGTPDLYARVIYNDDSASANYNSISAVNGIWIEAVRTFNASGNQGTAAFIDFHIKACWVGPGQVTPLTLGTVVRLYEPN